MGPAPDVATVCIDEAYKTVESKKPSAMPRLRYTGNAKNPYIYGAMLAPT